MTTIFGIRAFDPKKDKEYILMASDSQLSLRETDKSVITVCSYNCEKLLATSHKVMADAGTYINTYDIDSHNTRTNKAKQAYKNLKDFDLDKTEIITELRQISKEFDNSYIIGLNFDYRLNIMGYHTKYNFLRRRVPQIYNSLQFTFRGSGGHYAKDIIRPKLGEHTTSIDLGGKIIMPIEDLISLSIDGMQEASENDMYTGGHMDIAIITRTNIKLARDIIKL